MRRATLVAWSLLAMSMSSLFLATPASGAEQSACYCARYDYTKKTYEAEKRVFGIANETQCNQNVVKVEKPVSSCVNNQQFKNCTIAYASGFLPVSCTCTEVSTNKQVDRWRAECAAPDPRYKECVITTAFNPEGEGYFKACSCQENRTKCRWGLEKAEQQGGGSSTDVTDLQLQAQRLNQLKKFSSLQEIVGQAIKLLLSFVGSILLALYVYAGILYMTAGGNSERIDKAKQILVWATLGVAVMLTSYLIITYVFKIILPS